MDKYLTTPLFNLRSFVPPSAWCMFRHTHILLLCPPGSGVFVLPLLPPPMDGVYQNLLIYKITSQKYFWHASCPVIRRRREENHTNRPTNYAPLYPISLWINPTSCTWYLGPIPDIMWCTHIITTLPRDALKQTKNVWERPIYPFTFSTLTCVMGGASLGWPFPQTISCPPYMDQSDPGIPTGNIGYHYHPHSICLALVPKYIPPWTHDINWGILCHHCTNLCIVNLVLLIQPPPPPPLTGSQEMNFMLLLGWI